MPRDWRGGGIVAVVLLIGFLIFFQTPVGAATERISFFSSKIVVHADASMTVTETISVISTGQEIKRGIVRDFPTRYKDRYGNTVRVGFEILAIERDGRPEPYHTEKAANGVKIFIGQKDVYLEPGRHTFTITYKTDRQLGFFSEYDELYWNVTGTGWTFPIDSVQATVELPPGTKITQYAAYTGPFGAQGQDFRVSYDWAGNIVFTTTRGLAPREGLTIAVAWPKGIVRQPSAGEGAISYLRDNASLLSAGLGFLALLGYYLLAWFRVGRDPGKGTIIPLFEPPPGFSPAAVRYVTRMGFDAKIFATAVMNMAVKGYLRIKESDDLFVLEKKGAGQLFPEEQDLGRNLFGANKLIEIAQKHQRTIANARESLEKSLQKSLAETYFKTNRRYLWLAGFITLAMIGALIWTADDPSAAGAVMLFYAATCVIVAVFYAQWQNAGWFMKIFFLVFGSFWSLFSIIFGPAAAFDSVAVSVLLGSVLIMHLLFIHLLKAPTIQGRQVMDKIEGFKMYLSVAEKERLQVLHPPEKTPELFEKFLPYAFALDVENEWSEQFAEVLAKAATAEQEYTPTWYAGQSWNSRNLAGFSAGLGTALAASIASAATPPSSSSGSGGGGSSGGGGGGGGGSGW